MTIRKRIISKDAPMYGRFRIQRMNTPWFGVRVILFRIGVMFEF